MSEPFAYTEALAGESLELRDKFDYSAQVFNGVTHADFERFARTVAYKVAHNLKLGMVMDPDGDPLTYIDCGEPEDQAGEEWKNPSS